MLEVMLMIPLIILTWSIMLVAAVFSAITLWELFRGK
jgi:hypothetical protein